MDPIVNQWCGFQGPHLPDKERRLLQLLGAFAGGRDAGQASVTQETLARHLGTADSRRVARMIDRLVKSGHLAIVASRRTDSGQQQYAYTLAGVRTNWEVTKPADEKAI